MQTPLDRSEAERLVHTYSDLILRLSYTYLKSTYDAQDICQTIFLKLLQKPRRFDSEEHERAWIIRAAVNLCKDHLKSHWRQTTVNLDAAGAVPAPEAGDGSLLAAVNLLPLPDLREIMQGLAKQPERGSAKERAAAAAVLLQTAADQQGISLKLRKKPKKII